MPNISFVHQKLGFKQKRQRYCDCHINFELK